MKIFKRCFQPRIHVLKLLGGLIIIYKHLKLKIVIKTTDTVKIAWGISYMR